MPEGPSIVILKEELQPFAGKTIVSAEGNAKIDLSRLKGQKALEILSHGKQFFICFKGFYLRFHLMMFGTYRINEARENMEPRLSLKFRSGEINFYTCSVRLTDGDVHEVIDPATDTMSEEWDHVRALKALKASDKEMICDALLDQEIFAGVGNIIKNEVLWLVRIHPQALVRNISEKKLDEITQVSRAYCFDFYKWKKAHTLSAHWNVYRKTSCPRCGLEIKVDWPGKRKRKSFFCTGCQKLPKKKAVRKKKLREKS